MPKFFVEDIAHAVLMAKKSIAIQFCQTSTIHSKYPFGFTLIDISAPSLEQMAVKVANGEKTTGIISGSGYDNSKVGEIESIYFHSDTVESFSFC